MYGFGPLLCYLHETNPDNGLVRDKTDPTSPCSIAKLLVTLASSEDGYLMYTKNDLGPSSPSRSLFPSTPVTAACTAGLI